MSPVPVVQKGSIPNIRMRAILDGLAVVGLKKNKTIIKRRFQHKGARKKTEHQLSHISTFKPTIKLLMRETQFFSCLFHNFPPLEEAVPASSAPPAADKKRASPQRSANALPLRRDISVRCVVRNVWNKEAMQQPCIQKGVSLASSHKKTQKE